MIGFILKILLQATLALLFLIVLFVVVSLNPVVAQTKLGFQYVGGTWELKDRCHGQLQIETDRMAFKCKEQILGLPYESLVHMEYRPIPSNKIRDTRVRWQRKPPFASWFKIPWIRRENKYFSVVFTKKGVLGAVVFKVTSRVMLPYLAEIDLRSGKHVKMESFNP